MPDKYRIEKIRCTVVETVLGRMMVKEELVRVVIRWQNLSDALTMLEEAMWQPEEGYRYRLINEATDKGD